MQRQTASSNRTCPTCGHLLTYRRHGSLLVGACAPQCVPPAEHEAARETWFAAHFVADAA
jgi:hypothetical protein